MTDERLGEGLWTALARLPRGGGVVFRHYVTPSAERRRLFAQVMRIARRRGLIVVRAGPQPLRGAHGTHNRGGRGLTTYAVHDRRELIAARRAGADLVFVSPVFATRSHHGAQTLGAVRLGLLIRGARVPVVALGGMNPQRFTRLRSLKLWGWAAIDGWAAAAN